MIPSFPDHFVLLLLEQEPRIIVVFGRLVKKVKSRTEQQLRETKGIHLEAISGNLLFHSIRLDRGPRAKVVLEGDVMIFADLDPNHDEFYGKK